MTVSKLIAELQKVQAEHGDVLVEINGPEWLQDVDTVELCYPGKPGVAWYQEDKTQPVRSVILS